MALRRAVVVALAGLTLLATARAARARSLTSPADPALAGALTATFDGLTPTSAISLQTTVGTPPDTITITVTTTPGTEIFYGSCPSPPDGCIFSWTKMFIGTDSPDTIVFDKPVSAVAVTRGGNCYSDTTIEATTASGTTTITQVCPGGGPELFGGLADIGPITQVRLIGDATWDDLMVVPASAGPTDEADLATLVTGGNAAVLPLAQVPIAIHVGNLGPGTAHAPEVYALPPAGIALASGLPYEHWTFGDLGNFGATPIQQATYVMPTADGFACGAIHPVALVVSSTRDPVGANNLVMSSLRLDPSALTPQACVPGASDSDCDGLAGCWDRECANAPACVPVWPDLGPNWPLEFLWPPLVLPLDEPAPLPPEETDPDQNAPCELPIHGHLTPAPAYCCTSLIPVPEEVRWRDCHALDPNAIEADRPTDSRGYGRAEVGAYRFTIHYENIGGADAHDVGILMVLDERFDAATLAIEDGGSYDPETRTLRWSDPVVFPHDPRVVHVTVTAPGPLAPGDHLRAQATVIFPDAFPPSRIDTNVLDYATPDPAVPLVPDLAVFGCERVSDGVYRVRLTNRGFGFAFDAWARLIDPAPAVDVVTRDVHFANPADPDPATIASVTPISTTRSIDTVEIHGGGADPCEAARWEIHWTDASGSPQQAVVQAYADRDGDGVADYRAGQGDTGCCGAGGGGAGGALLTLLVLVGRRRARRVTAR